MELLWQAGMMIDLGTKQGRKKAYRDLAWGDHGFLRLWFHNQHHIGGGMYRANQPSPKRIAKLARNGIRTIVNLRGKSDQGYYLLEREACRHHRITLVDFCMYSRDTPKKDAIYGLKDIFERIEYPALMHCKSGADRTGIAGVLYRYFRLGDPVDVAVEQLELKYLHIRHGRTGMLDFFFEEFLAYQNTGNLSFPEWVDQVYDPAEVKSRFISGWAGNLLSGKILGRE